jgi:hypothetical protein
MNVTVTDEVDGVGGRGTVEGGRRKVDGGRWTGDGGRWKVECVRLKVEGGSLIIIKN